MLLFRFSRSFALRFAARTFLALLFQEPPRSAREALSSGLHPGRTLDRSGFTAKRNPPQLLLAP